MVWYKNNRFWFTREEDSGMTCLVQNLPYRDTFAWNLKVLNSAGKWLDYGWHLSARLAKQYAAKLKGECHHETCGCGH